MDIPKVTIIIPCYNAEKWINECIWTVCDQDYKNLEVIFVDNESTDNSLQIAKEQAARLETLETHPNLVIASAKNIYPNCWDEGPFPRL